MMSCFIYVCISVLIHSCYSLNNGLGLTPQMGWNSWNHFHCGINETIIRQTADAMVALGLAGAGYQYVNTDDCWQVSRTADGTIQADPTAFPSGIPALIDYIHSKGLKFGLYTDRGNLTCDRRPGSLGYEVKDAMTYASWGVDYVKMDSCFLNATPAVVEFSIMRDALNATGRQIFFSLCGGVGENDRWAPNVGNSWRTTDDIRDEWRSMLSNINSNIDFAGMAGIGGWNDPDMLEIGNGAMSNAEYITHFSLWSISKAPLIMGCDVTQMTASTLAILTNPEVIAVNQDALGIQGKRVGFSSGQSSIDISTVVIASCSSLSGIEPKRRQWTYDAQDGSIRSVFNGQCLSIDQCAEGDEGVIVLADCHIGDPEAMCQGKNQQWTIGFADQIVVSRMNGKCLDAYNLIGPDVDSFTCNHQDNQIWFWNSTIGTFITKHTGQCLTVLEELEIWAGPLTNGSHAVVLLNRGDVYSQSITMQWTDIGLATDRSATVRDLWRRIDLGVFQSNFTSPIIDPHASMMLKITPL